MRFSRIIIIITAILLLHSCSSSRKTVSNDSNTVPAAHKSKNNVPPVKIDTKDVPAAEVVEFAQTLIGIKYKYGSASKEQGFDCSGFISYVFNHFNIQVPRTSVSFTNAGREINITECLPGDLILFTGSDPTGWIVGHMGIITHNNKGKVKFIHSASGNNKGVMISDMNPYFSARFVKVIRIFN